MKSSTELLKKYQKIIIILCIVALILLIYWPVKDYGFINYDDQLYVTENIKTQSGLNIKNIVYIFKDFQSEGIWHPVTMLSHAMDWHLFKFNAGGHHWTNVIIHLTNGILLFLMFVLMTGAVWRSAFLAVLFTIHPINVESVAWIAERKNVLSTFFWFLTMIFYIRYVTKPNWKRYLSMLFSYTLGLMSKPMLVTLPFTLLLIDYWPLRRTTIESLPKNRKENPSELIPQKIGAIWLVLEKIPLFVLAAVECFLTIYTQKAVKAIVDVQSFPLLYRFGNSIISYVLYIKKMFWPFDLAVFYPLNHNMSIWVIFLCLLVVLTVTVVVVINFRKFPYLATGWFWYLGTLVPVIGIVQVGSQSMADRYAYVPLIGLFIILVWGISDFIKERKFKLISGLAALTTVLFMTIAARHQVYYWKDTLALFSRALDVTKNNAFAHSNVAGELLVQNRIDEAMIHCEKALLLNPNDYNTLIRAARGYNVRGEQDKAIDALRRAIKLHPKQLRAYNDLYNLLMQNGKTSEALDVYANVLDNVKDNPDIYYRYGIILARHGRYHDSIDQFKQALRLRSNDADILTQMGMVLTFLGKKIDAIECFKEALKINPNHLPAHYQLAVIYKQEGLMNQFYHHQNEVIRINPAYKNQLF